MKYERYKKPHFSNNNGLTKGVKTERMTIQFTKEFPYKEGQLAIVKLKGENVAVRFVKFNEKTISVELANGSKSRVSYSNILRVISQE